MIIHINDQVYSPKAEQLDKQQTTDKGKTEQIKPLKPYRLQWQHANVTHTHTGLWDMWDMGHTHLGIVKEDAKSFGFF